MSNTGVSILNKFSGASVLVTGHTGFKGSWLTAWLLSLGARVVGFAFDPYTTPSHFLAANMAKKITDIRGDVCDQQAVKKLIEETQPDFVFHLAAQAIVRQSYDDPISTWQTNVIGSLNVLDGLRSLKKPCAVIMVTSDKCYENVEWLWGYRETDALGGSDPYSASKAAAELAIRSHIRSYFSTSTSPIRVASVRAGNVIGGGDWSADRIVPDCVKAWSQDEIVNLRRPNATRPWQHVLEPLSGYLCLAAALSTRPELRGEAFNFGPLPNQNRTVLELVKQMALHWTQVKWEDTSATAAGPHEAMLLKLNCEKAAQYLNWSAVLNFEQTVELTSDWYRSYYLQPSEIEKITEKQIDLYVEAARVRGLEWAQV